MIYKMTLKDSVDTMTFNLLETPIVDKDIEGAVDNVTLDGNQYTDYLYLKKQYIQKWAIMCPDEYDELRGFYTRQFEEGEVPSYRVYYGANVTRDYTFNGDYFQFNAEGIETGMTLSQLTGNAEQTTYRGKNLASIETSATKTIGGVAFTIVDGVLNISNGTTAGYTNFYFDSFRVPNSGASVLWLEVSGYTPAPSDNCVLMLQESADNSTWTNKAQQSWGSPTAQNITLDNTKYYRIRIYAPPSVSFNNAKIKFQLEYGTKTDFEPYCGGVPSPNPDYPQDVNVVTGRQEVKITGKNLVEESIEANIDSSGKIVADNRFCMNIAQVVQGMTYTATEGEHFVAGFFTSKPSINSTSYDGQRIVVLNEHTHTFEAPITGYVAFRSSDGYTMAQLEHGSTPTSYEPYQGQSQTINLGGNLFDRANATENKVLIWSSAEYNDENKTIISDYISASVGQQFSTNYIAYIFCYNSSKTYLGTIETGGTTIGKTGGGIFTTFAIPSGHSVAYIRVEFRSGANSNLDMTQQDIMLNKGSTALPFAPYTTYAYELAKVGTYQDRIYKDDGKWYVEKQVGKVVFDGTTTLTQLQASTNTTRVVATISSEYGAPLSTVQLPLCDYFTGNSSVWATDVQGAYIQSRYTVLRANNTTVGTTLDSFKTWLTSHPTTVYYALATPTTTEITDETLRTQLNFLASLYEGENNISLMGTGAQGEMEVFIRDVMSVETDVVPEVPVRLTLTDDGVINACGCRRNVQLTMRETTE